MGCFSSKYAEHGGERRRDATDGGREHTTAINDDPAQHTNTEQAAIDAYKNSTDEQLHRFIEKVRSLQNNDYKNKISTDVNTETTRAVDAAGRLTGVDTSGFKNIIKGNAVQHIDRRHGENGTADHSMANTDDFSRIGFVLDHFTNAELLPWDNVDAETAKLSREWMNSDNTQAPLVRFSMPVNGVFYVVEAVPSSKAKRMAVVSAYISGENKGSTLKQVLNLSNQTGSGTPETPLAMLDTSDDKVTQRRAEVNSAMLPATEEAETATKSKQPAKGAEQKPGLVRDEYTASQDEHEMNIIDNVAKRLGVTVRFVDSVLGGKANAQHENGVIEIEKYNRNPVLFLFGHELTHYLQEVSPDSYQAFCDAAMMGTPNANAIVRRKIRLYEKNGVELERKDAIDELAADYAGQMMDNLNVLEHFIERHGENRTLLQHLADAFRNLIDRVGGRYRVNAKNAVTLLEKALDDGARAVDKTERQRAKENAATKGDVNYSINNTRGMTIREQMKEYRAKGFTSHDEFYYGKAPAALEVAGLGGHPLVMSQNDFKKAKSKKHNVPTRAMAKLAESLGDPILSFEVGDKIGVLTKDIDGDGKPLLIGITRNAELDGETVNRIKSAYGLDNPGVWVGNQIDQGKKLRIFDNKKADSFLDGFGYLAERPDNYRLGEIVPNIHKKVNFQLSLKEDDEAYLNAVREGDMLTAQRMVEKAAKAAGYTTQMLYHGTGRFGYTSYDMGAETASGGLIYATDKANVAANYGGSRDTYAFQRNINKRLMDGDSVEAVIHNAESVLELKTHVVTEAERKAAIKNVIQEFEAIAEALNSIDYGDFAKLPGWNTEDYHDSIANAYDLTTDLVWTVLGEYETNEDGTWERDGYDYLKTAAERFEEYYPKLREAVISNSDAVKGTTLESLYNLLLKHTLYDASVDASCTLLPLVKEGATVLTDGKQFREKEALAKAIDRIKNIGTYKLYGNPGDNVLEVDANGNSWLGVKVPEMGDEYHSTDAAANWAKENGYTSVYVKNVYDGGDMANEYIFFNPEQVKSADPVTYDDNGGVIPLSERFNSRNTDIRYDMKDDVDTDGAAAIESDIQTALALRDSGAAPSEVFNRTGLVLLPDGRLRNGMTGDIVWGYDDEQRRNEESAGDGALRRGGAPGGASKARSVGAANTQTGWDSSRDRGMDSGQNRQDYSAGKTGTRNWEQLKNAEKAAFRSAVEEYLEETGADVADTLDLVWGEGSGDIDFAIEHFAKEVFNQIGESDIVLENDLIAPLGRGNATELIRKFRSLAEKQYSMKNDGTHERLRQHLADVQREQNESAWDRLGAKITDEIKAAVQEAGVANSEVEQVQRALALRDAGATSDEIRDETHLDSNPDGSLEYMDLFEGDTVTVWAAEDEQRRKAAQGEDRAAAKASQKGAAKQSTRKRASDTARTKPYTAYAFAKRITSGDVQCDFDKRTIADSVRKIGLLLQIKHLHTDWCADVLFANTYCRNAQICGKV